MQSIITSGRHSFTLKANWPLTHHTNRAQPLRFPFSHFSSSSSCYSVCAFIEQSFCFFSSSSLVSQFPVNIAPAECSMTALSILKITLFTLASTLWADLPLFHCSQSKRESGKGRERARAQLLLSHTTVTSAAEQQNIWRDGLLKDYIRLDNITTQSQGREKERKWKLKAEVL